MRRLNCTFVTAALLLSSPRLLAAEERPRPNYHGKEDPTTAGDVAIWVPRIVLSPLYFVSEFVIRRPLGAALSFAERERLPGALYDFFTFDKEHKAGWAPTFFVDFGFKPSAGLYFFWDDAFARGNDIRLHAATWGVDWLALGFTDRVRLGPSQSVALDFVAIRRPDYRYYGDGPSSLESDLSRYGSSRIEAGVSYVASLGGASYIESAAGFRKVSFHDPNLGASYVSLLDRVDQGAFALPAGYTTGYTAGYSSLRVRLDSRAARARTGSGVRLGFGAEEGSAPDPVPTGWIRYGATLGAFADLNDRGRILSLSVATAFSDPLGSNTQPFTELVQLGGSEAMPGFLPGRLSGRSGAVATLGYHWPIWVWLNGTIQAAVGNVFSEHLRDFDFSLLRFSGAIGIETAGFSDNPVQILVGMGTETFEHGAQLNAVRFVFGTSNGF